MSPDRYIKPPDGSPATNQDDPNWSHEERAIVVYLRTNTSHTVDPGGATLRGRLYDFTLDKRTDPRPADGKSLAKPWVDSQTMLHAAKRSVAKGGQAPCLIFDIRGTRIDFTEAQNGVKKIAGWYGKQGRYPGKLNYVIVIGDGFYIEEMI